MISFIVSMIGLVIFIVFIILYIKLDVLEIPFILISTLGFAMFMLCGVWSIIGNTEHVNQKEYIKVKLLAEHFNELTIKEKIEVGSEIEKWNTGLNTYNNIWFKFVIEDRSAYIIELVEE